MFEAWLAVIAVVHFLGVLLQRTCPAAANAVVDWLCRPFLLLYAIVFATIGFYVNVYSLNVRPLWTTVVVAFATPATGLGVGALAAAVGGRLAADGGGRWRGVATETAVVNSGAVLTMIRLAVASDVDADVVSAPALWTAFSTPLTLVFMAALRQLLCTAGRQLQLISDEKQRLVRRPSSVPPARPVDNSARVIRAPPGVNNSHHHHFTAV